MMLELAGYQIGKLIYEGTRTLVYRGIDKENSRPVILKKLRREYPTFNELLQFRHQYLLTKNLDLPGIVKPITMEKSGNSYVLLMADVGGVSLSQYYKNSPLSLEEFFPVAHALCKILSYLYQNRIIHKDIKPSNILINPQTKEIFLIDFSIASLLPRETQTLQSVSQLEGTLAYISPEQTGRMNRGIDYRSDFYSLGVTFYELLTGQLPFLSDDAMELVHCHIAKKPTPPHQVKSEIPEMLSAIVMKLMAKAAEERYQSATGIERDLNECWLQWQKSGKISSFQLGTRNKSDRFLIPEKLYGRETEVKTLLEAFDRISAGNTEMMLVAGLSGIGKTAVVSEVHKPIVEKRGYFIQGKFDQFKRNIPLSAFVIAFRNLMEQLLGESDEAIKRWKREIIAALGEQAQVIIDVIPELENIIGEQPEVAELSGSAAQNRFNLLFGKFIQVFATAEHPLVIFLDDLQWADSASLNLIKLLISEAASFYLLLVGAYRDNEVYPSHPLMLTLQEMKKTWATINTITLAALSVKEINRLIADTLDSDMISAQPLTELVYQKTKGNPFFSNQFLRSLYEDGWFQFNFETGYWQCDITQMRKLSLTDNVVELMTTRIRKLPEATQEVLKLAACIGNQFDLETLAIVSEQSPTEAAASLWAALREGLVLPQDETYKFYRQQNTNTANSPFPIPHSPFPKYKFLHDRVQQAAYSLIPKNQSSATHLKIGQRLFQELDKDELSDQIFDVVNHFNLGQQFLLEEGEKQQVAELNFEAGLRAKSANAYANAARYFTTCTELLGQEGWQRQYRLTFSAHRYLAQALFLSGNFQQALVVIEFTRERAQSLLDRAEIYSLKIAQATMEARYSEAIDSGLEALAMVGIDLREEADLKLAIEREIAEIEQKLNGREVIDLLALPEMKAPDIKAIVKLLIDLDAPTYITSQIDLYGFINVKAVSLSIEYGNCVESVKAYANYGLILGYLQGKYQLGYQFGNLAIQLSDRLKSPSQKSKACLLVGGWIQVWSQPIIGAEKINFEGFKSGLESGEIQFAGYNIFAKISNLIFQGCPLNVIRETIEQYWDFADKSQNQLLLEALTGMEEYAMTLTEISVREGTRFRGVTEEEFIVRCQRSQSFLALCLYYVLKMEIACIYGKFDEGLKSAVAATEILGSIQGFTTFAKYGYYASLIYLNLEEGLSSEEVNAYQQQLQIWMESCPENFSCMYFLVAAERHRRQQQKLEAIELYDRAIAEAKANGFIHQEALANELAAKFYFNWGKEKIARTYLIDAYYCYSQWGAKAKVADLEKRYRQLLAPIFQSDKTSLATNATISAIRDGKTSSTNTDTNILLDFASAFKASMAIAGEIELVGLLSKLMEVVMENAGATKSALLLLTGDTLVMEAIAGYSEDGTLEMMSLENSLPVESNSELPQSIINTVKRSEEALVINDLSKQTRFASDLYLLQYQPQSILCMPLLDRGQLRGILYLENQLTTGVFSSDRLELLKVLAAQAAISLENARLYQSLEQKVAERTQELNDKSENLQATLTELQQTQAQLIQTEKMSSLGRMVAGIAHEINNPTTFIQGNIEPARHYFEDLLELIKIYQEDVPNASSRISEKLEEIELDYLQEDLEKIFASMRNGCDRIRAIVQGLRTFSRLDEAKTKFTDLHANLDSTLMLLEHRLLNSELGVPIEVIRTYGTLPKVTCNISLINQVFFEIISNAIDAICSKKEDLESDPPAIKITTETVDAQRVKITISDNGEGMSEETRAKIFDPFFSTKSVGKGTGLGLSTSYQIIVGEHGGTLSCSSELLRGTKLTLTLPVVPLKSLPTSDTVF